MTFSSIIMRLENYIVPEQKLTFDLVAKNLVQSNEV